MDSVRITFAPMTFVADKRSVVRYGAIVAVIAAHLPLTAAYYARLWSLPHYQFFPLALVGAALLAGRERHSAEAGRSASAQAAAWLVAGLTTLTIAVVLDSSWCAAVASLISLQALWCLQLGASGVRRMLPATLMLTTTIRPPLAADLELILALQSVTAGVAGNVLDLLQVIHVPAGNVIEIPGRQLFVDQACSGVNSLFSAAACTLFYLLWSRRGLISSSLLFLTIPFWVVSVNAGRIVAVTWLRAVWNVPADEGWAHESLGLAAFAITFGLIVSTERLIYFYASLLVAEPETPTKDETAKGAGASRRVRTSASLRPSFVVLTTCVALLVVQVPDVVAKYFAVVGRVEERAPPTLDERGIAAALPDWKVLRREDVRRASTSPFGEYSRQWLLDGDGASATASLDYPFTDWHDLSICYAAQGWFLEDRAEVEMPAGGTRVTMRMRHPQTGRHGYVVFGLVDEVGRPLHHSTGTEHIADRAAAGWRRLTRRETAAAELRRTYQFQLVLESYAPPAEAQLDGLRRGFDELFGEVRRGLERMSAQADRAAVGGGGADG